MLTRIQIVILVAACALTATITVCAVQWHEWQQQQDQSAAFRQAIYQTLKPPATVQDPGIL